MSTTNWTQVAGMTGDVDVENVQDYAETATEQAAAASASATAASASATAAASSASSASSSASSASSSASSASTSASAAQTAETNAETAQTGAETALASAEAALVSTQALYDNFDDRYLGAKASDPTVDNDGDALIDGALYFDTTNAQMKVYDLSGTSWESFSLTAAQLADVDTVADNISDISAVATIDTDVSSVAAIDTDVSALSAVSADVTTCADNIADIQAAVTSASNASDSADAAAASASGASGFADAASTSASQASGFAGNASDSATAAAASAASAATAFDDFDDKYLGAKSSAPTTDNDGDPLVTGALYYDTTEGSMYVYEGSAWVKASASIVNTWDEFVYTATNAQTAFTGADDNTNTLVTSDYMIVTRNGVRLTEGVGYTVTTGTVTLATGAATGDIITITSFASLQVADTLSLSQGGTVTGAVTFNGNVDGIAFSEIDSTPTTIAGYGITDAFDGAYSSLIGSPTAVSSFTNDSGYITDYTVTQGDVTAHQAALSITESQISDLQSYLTSIPDNYILNTGDAISGDLTFGDNNKAIFGAGSDLQIYHNGSHSYIDDAGTGNLYLKASNNLILRSASNEDYLDCTVNGAVRLYYDNSAKLATTSTGVDVTGTVTADGVSLGDNEKAQFGAGSDLQIYHDGSNSYIKDAGTGTLRLQGATSIAIQTTGGDNMAQFVNNGATNLFYNGSQKLATTSTGVSVTGDLTASGNVTAYSDERLKSDIATIDNALDKVSAMRGVTYTKDGELSSGVIAQELQQVAPELVIDGEYLSVAYGNLVGYLIEAVKELKAEVEELKGAK